MPLSNGALLAGFESPAVCAETEHRLPSVPAALNTGILAVPVHSGPRADR